MRGNKFLKFVDYYIGIPLVWLLSFFAGGNRNAELRKLEPKRILVVKLVALGDAVLLVPSLRALRRHFPDAEITFLGTSLTENIIKQFPEYVDNIISVDVVRLGKSPSYAFGMISMLRSLNCDVVIDFEQWTRLTPLLLAFGNIPVRIGFKTVGQHHHYLYTHAVERTPSRHEAKSFLSLVELFTQQSSSSELELKVNQAKRENVIEWLRSKGWSEAKNLVIIHPACGAHGFPREWSPKNYREVIEKLGLNEKLIFIITGTSSESNVMNEVCALHTPILQNSTLQYSIKDGEEFIALLSIANLFISGNTGAMHLASALKVPQVALHGPTNADIWGPINPNAIVIKSSCPHCPCLDLGFEYHRTDGYCMEQICVEEVIAVCERLLSL
ncbi:MAG: glycosyltransferase family 9 protein [Ignavibacteriae bacterium]|nr:glycosyltransferase family 9 protein [Ignavibacteriota bacterium]